MGTRIFRDVDGNEYIMPQEKKPLRQIGHKALWEYGPEGIEKGWLATWDSYVILGQPSGSRDSIWAQFSQIDTVGEAMRAYRSFQGFPCLRCEQPFFAGHVCSERFMREDEAIVALAKELHRLYCNAVFKTACPDLPALPALWESLSVHSQRFFIQFAKDVKANGIIGSV